MGKLILFIILISFNAFADVSDKIKPVECKVWRGVRSEVRIFTLHDNYSLLIPFDNLETFIVADHGGNAGAKGIGYRYILFIKDPRIGGFVQGASSSMVNIPLSLQDISFEDLKYKVRVRCKSR